MRLGRSNGNDHERRGAISTRRRLLGFAITVFGLPLLSWPLVIIRDANSLPIDVLAFQLLVVVVALAGGIWPALLAAVAAGFVLDFFFVPPLYLIRIAEPAHFVTLIIFLIVASLVSIVVDQAARRLRIANRLSAEAVILSAEASRVPPLAAANRMRSALLAAVGHDLRRPLAAATTAVTSLRSKDVELSAADSAELLEAADVSLKELSRLVTDLLDASRLQAGVLGVSLQAVTLDDIVGDALDELEVGPGDVELDLGETTLASADPALLQRVLVNLLTNALRYEPNGSIPKVATMDAGDRVQLSVIDNGPGVPQVRREEMFLPFQRLGDTDNSAGVGLGLALARGFVEGMGGTITAAETPGGGLTMMIALNSAQPTDQS